MADDQVKFRTEDGRWVDSREEAATITFEAYGETWGPFTPREVGYLNSQGL